MNAKLEKVLWLYRSTTHDGEKRNARTIVEAMLNGSGTTFAEALASLDGSGSQDRPRSPKETPGEAKRRRERAARRADIVARYGSEDAVLAPTPEEQAIMDALASWRVVNPGTGATAWIKGLSLGGKLESSMVRDVKDAMHASIPWPRTYPEAVAEHDRWEAREDDLRHITGDWIYPVLDLAVQLRADMIFNLVEHEMPGRTPVDLVDRLRRYRKAGNAWRTEMLDAIDRDLLAMSEREHSQKRPHPSASVHKTDDTVDSVLQADPSRSDRDIARQFGCSPTTVGKARARLGIDITERSVHRGGQIYRMKRRVPAE